ncbi:MAG: chromate transporter [Paludibacteraceae bacterium]|nr:chromate transporter [Paludibacteraceae bacterium]
MLYLQLFISFFKIGLFGFGGGYAIISLIQHEIETYGWMTSQEFVDIVAVSQMTPGPIGINSATYVGYKACLTAGYSEWMSVLGSVVATSSIILPSVIIMLIVCQVYLRLKDNKWVAGGLASLRITVIGLIAAAALLLMTGDNFIDWWSVIFFALVFFGTLLFKAHPILLIVLAGMGGYAVYGPLELDRFLKF